jgi:hypothetical protein
MVDNRVLPTETEAHLIDELKKIRATLQEGVDLVSSAYAHVSHGGPTRKEALDWIKKANIVLGSPH